MKLTVQPISAIFEVRTILFKVEGPTSEQFCTPEMVMHGLFDDFENVHASIHMRVWETYPDADLIECSVRVLKTRVMTATFEQYLEQKTRYWFEATVTAMVQVHSIGGEQ